MTHQLHDGQIPPHRDPVDSRDQEFDWGRLYVVLNEDATSQASDPRLAQVVVRMLRLLLPTSGGRIQPGSLGVRLVALAWVLDPSYFEGSPSIRKLARRCGIRVATLAAHTGALSRLLGWRNRGQRHAWNWQRDATPCHRGESANPKLKRNVPTLGGRREAGAGGCPDAEASGGENAPQPAGGGVDPSLKTKRMRTGRD